MTAIEPRWSSFSYLLYAGGLTVLGAAVWALEYLAGQYGQGGFAGWSLLVLAVLAAIALAFRRQGRWIAAGVFATAAVVAFAVLLGALERWFGWLPKNGSSPFDGFRFGLLAIELLTGLAALLAIRVFRFPLLTAVAAAVAWFFLTDLLSGGGDWSAVVTFLVGLGFLIAGVVADRGKARPYGFWLHVAAGLTIGGSLLFFWHTSDAEWWLVAVAGVAYIGLAAGLGRSSYAVLGSLGLLFAAEHFASAWGGSFVVGFFGLGGNGHLEGGSPWAKPLVFAGLGFLLVLLGLLVERRRAHATQ